MAQIDPASLQRPIVTGTGAVSRKDSPAYAQPGAKDGAASFFSVLQNKLEAGSNTAFSRHAVSRVHERQIDISDQNLERLNRGVRLAQQKGLRDALILIDQSAYIVSVTAGKVITVDGGADSGSVFTNIDGTVII